MNKSLITPEDVVRQLEGQGIPGYDAAARMRKLALERMMHESLVRPRDSVASALRKFAAIVILVCGVSFLLSECANAQEIAPRSEMRLLLACCSKHWPVKNGFNETNRGVGLMYISPSGQHGLVVGAHDNSFDHKSSYFGYAPLLWEARRWGFKFESRPMLVMVDGYGHDEHTRDQWKPAIVPAGAAIHEKSGIGLGVIGIPGIMVAAAIFVRLP